MVGWLVAVANASGGFGGLLSFFQFGGSSSSSSSSSAVAGLLSVQIPPGALPGQVFDYILIDQFDPKKTKTYLIMCPPDGLPGLVTASDSSVKLAVMLTTPTMGKWCGCGQLCRSVGLAQHTQTEHTKVI